MELQGLVADGQLLIAVLIALAAGLVSFLSPCVLPLIPGYLAYVAGASETSQANGSRPSKTSPAGGSGATSVSETGASDRAAVVAADPRRALRAERRRMVLGASLFVLGFALVFLLIFVIMGSVGQWLWEWQDLITRVMGAVVIVMGLVFMGAFSAMQRTSRLKLKPRIGLAGAPLLGIVFAVGWAPCMGPTLGTVAMLAMQSGSVPRASALALAYCIGLGLPFILAAFGFSWMAQTMTFFKRHIRVVNLIGGGLLIVIGLLMVTGLWSEMMFSMQAVISDFGTIL